MSSNSALALNRLFGAMRMGPVDRGQMADALSAANRWRRLDMNLPEARKQAAIKDVLADTPSTGVLGLGDTPGAALTGVTTIGSGTATSNDSCSWVVALPNNYIDGEALRLVVRAKSQLATVAQTVDAVVKALNVSDVLGSDICATAIQTLTASYANYTFTITPTGLVAGQNLLIELYLARNDTGGALTGAPTCTQVYLEYQGFLGL